MLQVRNDLLNLSGLGKPLIVDRKTETEATAAVRFALDPDPAAMGEDEVFDDGEAEAGAAEFARASLVDPVEALEQAGQILFWDADARILHGNLDFLATIVDDRMRGDRNGPTRRGVFQGIIEQVRNDLVHRFGVAEHFDAVGGRLELDGDLLLLGERLQRIHTVL